MALYGSDQNINSQTETINNSYQKNGAQTDKVKHETDFAKPPTGGLAKSDNNR